MKASNKQHLEELETVKWYIEVLESGIDTKDIQKEYTILKKKFKHLSETSSKKIKKLE